ncbi:TPA: hypothetical protein ACLE2F_000874 [Klebsiella variicola]
MTTDITELAQSEINDALAQLKQISEYPTPSTQYARVLRKYFASLVEALELKEEQRANWSQMAQKLGEDLDAAEKRIAELESRTVTVKLPDIMPPEAAPAHYWGSGESMAYADGYNKSAADLKTSFAQACSSVGVNVEFE